jgi:hypothetical protein
LAVLESIPPGSQTQRPSARRLVLIGVLVGFAEGEGVGEYCLSVIEALKSVSQRLLTRSA